jgi:hypothetical protein
MLWALVVCSPSSTPARLAAESAKSNLATVVPAMSAPRSVPRPAGFSVVAAIVNKPPVVKAGSSQTITLPAGATLNGSVTDDGLPVRKRGDESGRARDRDDRDRERRDRDDDHGLGTLTSAWSQVRGPGTARFAYRASPVTTVTFDRAGTYVLRLTASDSELSASSDVTITVKPPIANTPPVVKSEISG